MSNTAFPIDDASREEFWVWKRWLARGTVTALDGAAGAGKTTFACELALRLAAGLPLVGETVAKPPDAGKNRVVWMCSGLLDEAAFCKTAARLNYAPPADLDDGVHFFRPTANEPNDDGWGLFKTALELRPKLLVIDDLDAFVVKRRRQVDILRRLGTLAADLGVAVLVLRRLGSRGAALAVPPGTIVCRLDFDGITGPHDDDDGRRLLLPILNSFAGRPPIEALRLATADAGPAVEWLGPATRRPSAAQRKAMDLEDAKTYLIMQLERGPVPIPEIRYGAHAFGIAPSDLAAARRDLGILTDFARPNSLWRLPKPALVMGDEPDGASDGSNVGLNAAPNDAEGAAAAATAAATATVAANSAASDIATAAANTAASDVATAAANGIANTATNAAAPSSAANPPAPTRAPHGIPPATFATAFPNPSAPTAAPAVSDMRAQPKKKSGASGKVGGGESDVA